MAFTIQETNQGVIFKVRLKPKGKNNRFVTIRNECILLEVQAPPCNGKANLACLKLIASLFCVKASNVVILSGIHTRDKVVVLYGMSKEKFQDLLKLIKAEHL